MARRPVADTTPPPTTIDRLLASLYWDGNVLRRGGRGRENVLTAEVFQALDFLPREQFLGAVLEIAHGADDARARLIREVEAATFTIMPGNFYLAERGGGRKALWVQPDGLLRAPGVLCFLESKRIKTGSFQPEQLAREYLALLRATGRSDETPLLLLVLPKGPEVRVSTHGQPSEVMSIQEAVGRHMDDLLVRTDAELGTRESLMGRLGETVAWVSWAEIRDVLRREPARLGASGQSMNRAIQRMATITLAAIKWHEDGVELPPGPREPIVPPICVTCIHHRGAMWQGGHCEAFPGGIPPAILRNDVDHRKPAEDDNGVQWSQDPAAPRLDHEYYDHMFGESTAGVVE